MTAERKANADRAQGDLRLSADCGELADGPLKPPTSMGQHPLRAVNQPRQSLDLGDLPPLLNAAEMARVFRLGVSQFYRNAKRGLYDAFKVKPVLGARCYSKALLVRYLAGEPLYEPVFGGKRKRG